MPGVAALSALGFHTDHLHTNVGIVVGAPLLLRLVSYIAFRWHTRYTGVPVDRNEHAGLLQTCSRATRRARVMFNRVGY